MPGQHLGAPYERWLIPLRVSPDLTVTAGRVVICLRTRGTAASTTAMWRAAEESWRPVTDACACCAGVTETPMAAVAAGESVATAANELPPSRVRTADTPAISASFGLRDLHSAWVAR